MSKPSLRLQLTKLLLYNILLWQLGRWPQSKFICRADASRLPEDEVFALRDFMSNTELRPEQIIEETYCSDVVWTYGFIIECHCTNESGCWITGIRMSYIGLTGTIHESVGYLRNLTYLILSNNKLHGRIPDTLGNLTNLQILDLSQNQLNGSIPASLGLVVSLRLLYLQYNLLSGDIPRSFGSLKNLTELNLQFNMLSGSIPEDFGNLSSLKIMDLSENQLSGPLPESLGKLKNLATFYVSANNLSEEFPKGYGDLTSLKKFSIAGNYISGPLPVETIANWTNITHLVLVGNNFEGNLTEKIFRLQKLQHLLISDLANNSFQLPAKINNSANLISLTLRNCSITGPIPKYIGEEMKSLRYLDLSFNKLTGGLPQYMKSNMTDSDMSFSGNMLDGTIPPWILLNGTIAPQNRGDFQTRIDLSFNNFSAGDSPVPSNQQLNLFACCRIPTTTEPQMMDPFEMKNRYCPENKPKYHSLFINCGGEETTVLGNKYDQDNDTSPFFTSPKKNWAYSLSGGYGVPETNTSNYIKSMTCGVPITEAPLYENARLSPVSLKYYAFCLREGNYTVTLYFNETVCTKNEDYTSLKKRVFDVYIQDVWRLNYNKIRVKEGSTEKPINISAVVVSDSGLLNIHLYWPGKGSFQYLPGFNGPLISAISVTPEFKISPENNNGQRVALITIASIVAASLLSLAFAWRMGWLPSEKLPTSQDPTENIHQNRKQQVANQQVANQSKSVIVEEGDTEKHRLYENKERQQQPQSVRRGKSSDKGSTVFGEGTAKASQDLCPIENVQQDCKQQAANQPESAIVEEGDTNKHWLYGNKERQQQPQNVRRGKSSDKGSTVFGKGAAKFPWCNMRFLLGMLSEELPTSQNLYSIENVQQDCKQQPANQSESAVVEEGDTEKHWLYGNKERQQQPQSVRRGKSSDKGSAVFGKGAAKFPWCNMRFLLGMSSEELPTSQNLYSIENVQQDCKQQPANQSESAVVEEGDTEKHWLYGNKEQQQQPHSVRRGKSSDKGSAVFGKGAAKFPWCNMRFPLGMSSEELPTSQDLYPIGNVQQDCKQQAANQSESAVVEEDDTEKHWLYGNKERQQQPQSVHRGKSNDKGSAVFGEGAAKFPWCNMRFPLGMSSEELPTSQDLYPIENVQQDCKQQAANQSESAVIEEGDTEKHWLYGNKERQQQPQSVRRGKSSDKGSAVFGEGAAKFSRSNMRFPLGMSSEELPSDEHQDKLVTVKELINATENFSDKKKLGHSETFFMAQLPGYTVVVKKLDSTHFKGKIDKLEKEIAIIESLQHNNILKLLHAYIGEDLQFLVYEYMENKSLEDILFGSSTSSTIKLDWNTRVNICLGIAQGLQYLHETVQIVHTNIKSANILLNEKLEAKISDFGFANLYSEEDKVMAIARETKKGYTAPEYLQTDDLDSKLDVFSFGVVVLEIVSGERNVRNQSNETEVLLDRAYKANRNGNLNSLVDKNLSTYDEGEALIILKLAVECTSMCTSVRPAMSGVVSVLLGEKSIDEVCPPAKPTGDINVVGSTTSGKLTSVASTLSLST